MTLSANFLSSMGLTPSPLITFGTYNYEHQEILEDAANQAMYLWRQYQHPQLIDTAMKYRNLHTILKVMERHPDARIGWKVEHFKLASSKGLPPSQSRSSKLVPETTESPLENGTDNKEGAVYGVSGGKLLDHNEGRKSQKAKNIQDGLDFLKARVPKDKIFRILLHNYCGKKVYLEFQHLVEQEFGADMPIGICNVSADQLEDLVNPGEMSMATTNDDGEKARVDWVQNEYHPFLETRVPDVCRKHGISFESHSIMTSIDEYADLFKRIGVSDERILKAKPAHLALKFAAKQGGVCFATTNFVHLMQDLQALLGPPGDTQDDILLSSMSEFPRFKRLVRYRGAETCANVDWVKVCDPVQIREEILPKLKRDIASFEAGKIPSNLCTQIPKSFRPGGKVSGILAEMLYGEDLEDQMAELKKKLEQKLSKQEESTAKVDSINSSVTDDDLKTRLVAKWNCQLNSMLSKMRQCINEAHVNQRYASKKAPNPVKAVEQPDALPMDDYPEAEEFADLVQFLKTGGCVDTVGKSTKSSAALRVRGNVNEDGLPTNIRFQYGTINSDGRLDLCKQGFRKAFSESCDAVIQDGGKELPVNILFKYGTINSDGRLDMCKQGFRKAFSETCEAVIRDRQNQDTNNKKPLIKHYLIGNNRIGEDGDSPGEGSRRVAALARMIRHRPDIVTWFLAGNSMNSVQIQCVAEALEQTQSKYVWLKMNPVKTGAYYLGKMVVRNHHIELLDLFNCGLCNDGFAAFAQGMADAAVQNPTIPYSNLRHLYVSINAINSAREIERTLHYLPYLESLFLGVNPFGDEGLKEIADVIIHKTSCRETLKRLNMGSMALTDASLPLIKTMVAACPNLVSLELDSYKSTNYFDQKHNRFNVENEETRKQLKEIAEALVHNARCVAVLDGKEEKELPTMHYLGLQHALVVGDNLDDRTAFATEAKVILRDFVANELFRMTGINVNGITNLYPCKDGTSYRHVGEKGVRIKLDLTRLDRDGKWEIEDGEEDEAFNKLVKSVCSVSSTDGKMVGGGLFYLPGVSKDDLRTGVRHPWPALDYIKSIYRNTMKA